ncbi:hypothetical protein PVMG_02552 [Plasmodium vivax Mauritania I]|uniref:Variable surface protein Vir35 n=1 Tax=Plasmodium vivax Mauritania I TaxID=1035515 RepID=A0A0J9W348_PLAVI|nr:hypothetical protein PVMG_02552 [Plasmodium vivax Mauritania I]
MNLNILKIFKSLFLIWTLKNYYDMVISDESSENYGFIDKIPNVLNNRLLAKYELHDKRGQKDLTGALSQNITYNRKKNEASDISSYEELSKRSLNNSEIYKKSYRQKHVKKKGLSKLDDKFEKKLFDKMDLMYKLAKNRKNKNNSLNNIIFNKFSIKIFLLGLLPISGLIFLELFNGKKNIPGTLNWCSGKTPCTIADCTANVSIHGPEDAFRAIEGLILIFSCLYVITVVLMIIYTFIKVIKYVGLKNGRDNMRAKEYFHLCKEIFPNK